MSGNGPLGSTFENDLKYLIFNALREDFRRSQNTTKRYGLTIPLGAKKRKSMLSGETAVGLPWPH